MKFPSLELFLTSIVIGQFLTYCNISNKKDIKYSDTKKKKNIRHLAREMALLFFKQKLIPEPNKRKSRDSSKPSPPPAKLPQSKLTTADRKTPSLS